MGIERGLTVKVDTIILGLKGRKQRVCVEEEMSDWKPVTSGISQGSVLGPPLFVNFISDMPIEVKFNIFKLFADDSKLYGIEDVLNTSSTIQSDLNMLTDWSVKWQQPFNVDNYKSINLSNKNPNIEYHMHGITLDNVQDERFECNH